MENEKYLIEVQKINASDDYYLVAEISKTKNSFVEIGEVIGCYESSKTAFEIVAEVSGYITYKVKLGDKVIPGSIFAEIAKTKQEENIAINKNIEFPSDIIISDRARKLLEDYNLDYRILSKNLIREKDVLDYLSQKDKMNNIISTDIIVETDFVNYKKEIHSIRDIDINVAHYKMDESALLGINLKVDCDNLEIEENVKIGDNVVLTGGFIKIGKNTRIGSDVIVTSSVFNGNLIIGNNCMIGSKTYLNIEKDIIIEDDSCISSDCKLITHRQWHSPLIGGDTFYAKILIRRGAFIGPSTIIMPGIIIGEFSTILANSSIINDVPEKVFFGGVPGKILNSGIKYLKEPPEDKKVLLLLNLLKQFNGMKGNGEWILNITKNHEVKISSLNNGESYNIHIILDWQDSYEPMATNCLFVLIKGLLPEYAEGIEIQNKLIKIKNIQLAFYIKKLFFNAGIHL